ncbi:MAG TPA: hypothetical protein VFM68_03670 [Candidatus Saccharimonadales bacterium]|nr:hypothetical protein [Candidatus Saccharimonadales bacterium]
MTEIVLPNGSVVEASFIPAEVVYSRKETALEQHLSDKAVFIYGIIDDEDGTSTARVIEADKVTIVVDGENLAALQQRARRNP